MVHGRRPKTWRGPAALYLDWTWPLRVWMCKRGLSVCVLGRFPPNQKFGYSKDRQQERAPLQSFHFVRALYHPAFLVLYWFVLKDVFLDRPDGDNIHSSSRHAVEAFCCSRSCLPQHFFWNMKPLWQFLTLKCIAIDLCNVLNHRDGISRFSTSRGSRFIYSQYKSWCIINNPKKYKSSSCCDDIISYDIFNRK